VEHDLFGKPGPTFPDHALTACSSNRRIAAHSGAELNT
jgi:hypothetical protein